MVPLPNGRLLVTISAAALTIWSMLPLCTTAAMSSAADLYLRGDSIERRFASAFQFCGATV